MSKSLAKTLGIIVFALNIMFLTTGCSALRDWAASEAQRIAVDKAVEITSKYNENFKAQLEDDMLDAFERFEESEAKSAEMLKLVGESIKGSLKDAVVEIPARMAQGQTLSQAVTSVAKEEGIALSELIMAILSTLTISGIAGKEWGKKSVLAYQKAAQKES